MWVCVNMLESMCEQICVSVWEDVYVSEKDMTRKKQQPTLVLDWTNQGKRKRQRNDIVIVMGEEKGSEGLK